MKIAIFENEYSHFKTIFDGFNLIYFKNSLEFKDFKSSQIFGDLSRLKDYDVVIIDIDLTPASEMDGYQLISAILNLNLPKTPNIMVLTGHHSMKEQLKERQLPEYPIISKPLSLKSIKSAFESYSLL
jgi:CheY-like chemotaxis protein